MEDWLCNAFYQYTKIKIKTFIGSSMKLIVPQTDIHYLFIYLESKSIEDKRGGGEYALYI